MRLLQRKKLIITSNGASFKNSLNSILNHNNKYFLFDKDYKNTSVYLKSTNTAYRVTSEENIYYRKKYLD